jgi:hypothetical protein
VLEAPFVIVAAAAAPSGAEVAFRDRRGCGRFVSGRSRLRPLPLVLKSRFVIVAAAAAPSGADHAKGGCRKQPPRE